MAARAQTVQHVLLAPIAVPGQRLGVSWVGDATCSSVLCGRSWRTAPRAGAAQAGPAARGRLVSPVHPAAPAWVVSSDTGRVCCRALTRSPRDWYRYSEEVRPRSALEGPCDHEGAVR
jgi:hypothetical protein